MSTTGIEPAEREHLLDALADLIAARGWEHFVRAPTVLPTPACFPDPWTPDEAGVWRLSKRLLHYAGFDALDVAVELFADDDAAAQDPTGLVHSEHHTSAAAWFAGIEDGVCHFGANVSKLDDPLGVTAALAHESAHAFRRAHALELDDLLAEEQLTDLTAVYLGFGVLGASAAARHRSWNPAGDVFTGARSFASIGYLSPQAMCLLLACQSAARGGRDRAIERALESNQAGWYRGALASLGTPDEVRRRLGIPRQEEWPEARAIPPLAPLGASPYDVVETLDAAPAPATARFPESRAHSLALVGLLVGIAAMIPFAVGGQLGLGLGAWAGCVAFGIVIGRRFPRWFCARCNALVAAGDPICRACGARITRVLARAEDRLDDHQPPPRGDLAAAPYRDHGLGLGFSPEDIDGSSLPSKLGVLQPSTEGERLGAGAIEAMQRRLDVVLSPSHAAYMQALGPGVDSDVVELWSEAQITAERHASLAWIRKVQWDADDRLADLPPELCVVIGQTDDGDRLALHPGLPGRLLWMRAEVREIVECDGDFGDAIDTICALPPDRVRWFAPPSLRPRGTGEADGALDVAELLARVLEFGAVCLQREHDETDDDESWLVLAPGIGGWVRLQRQPGAAWAIEVASDQHSMDAAKRMLAALES